jgi:hypothetical protein
MAKIAYKLQVILGFLKTLFGGIYTMAIFALSDNVENILLFPH